MSERLLKNLIMLLYQPPDALPDLFGASDVLLTV